MKAFSPVFIIIILLTVAAVIGAVAIFMYRRRINKALAGEGSGAHTNIPAPADTLSGLFKAVILILLVWVCISMGRIGSLEQQIEDLRSSEESNTFSINQSIDALKAELKETNSRVYSYTSTCGNVDTSDNSCMVKHTVKLKSFADDTEVIFIAGDGTEAKMENTGAGKFEVELKADLFKSNTGYTGIAVKENGTNYFEEIEDGSFYGETAEYWKRFIPCMISEFGATTTYTKDKISIGNIVMFSEIKSDYRIASAKVVIEKNGTEVESIDAKNAFDVPYGDITIPVNKDYTFSDKDSVCGKLILVTEDGYTLDQKLFDVNDGRYITYGNSFTVNDRDGKAVYTR